LRPDQVVVRAGLFLLLLTGLVSTAALGGEHLPRVLASCLALGLGWSAGVSWARRRSRTVRLAWVAAGVVGALCARWFVPTTQGVSLWTASRMADRLETYPVSAPGGFAAGQARRQAAVRQFPQYAEEIQTAERVCLRRCVDAAIGRAAGLLQDNPRLATRPLRDCDRALGRLIQNTDLETDLRNARRQTIREACMRIQAELELQIKFGDYSIVAEEARAAADELRSEAQAMGVAKEVQERLLDVRRKAVLACLEAARQQRSALVAKERFGAVAALGTGLARTLKAEAEAVGSTQELEEFCAACQLADDKARVVGKKD
jgi:hypothetical protein